MLSPTNLYDYQRRAALHQLYHDDSMLWLEMGLGKSVITLSSIVHRMQVGQVKKVLIFGPLRVIYGVWEKEALKWEHTKHLRFSIIHGSVKQREAALFRSADIYLCNYESMAWLANELNHYYISQNKPLPFEMVVYDEITKVKNSQSQRIKGGTRTIIRKAAKLLGQFKGRKMKDLDKEGWSKEQLEMHGHLQPAVTEKVKMLGWRKMIPHFKYRTGLTGSPAPNGYMDIFGQYLVIDGGERLGEYITHYRDAYFVSDYMGFSYVPTDNGKAWIEHKISDITLKMDAADYLELPDVIYNDIMVDLPDKVREQYEEIEKDLFTRLDDGTEIELFNRSSVSNKCLQFCNGSPYVSPESPEWKPLHDVKLDALEDVIEEAAGNPVLVSYTFKSDAERIMEKFKSLKPVNMTKVPGKQLRKTIDNWNDGKIKLMIGHPACLHPDTQVLTKRDGWIKIIDVEKDDMVFDGVEYVSHDGCMYAGYKEVIDVFNITMTPDHKVWINNEWVEGQHVDVSSEGRGEAEFRWENENVGSGKVQSLWSGTDNALSEHGQAQQNENGSLSFVQVSSADRYSYLEDMVRIETSCEGHIRRKLRRSWRRNVRRVARLPEVLRRHVTKLLRRSDDRAQGCERTLLERQLRVGDSVCSTEQQANNPSNDVSGRSDSSGRVSPSIMRQQDDVNHAVESRNDCRRSGTRCSELTLREEQHGEEREASRSAKAHVYDLVNCGPRHRFLVRNNKGEMFIVKNSMGHGIDGLQENGHIVVWFGLNWNLELYEQFNARLNRQGQTKPVIIHRILCEDTLDLAVSDSLIRKTDDQMGLKQSIQRYRDGNNTSIDKPNFL